MADKLVYIGQVSYIIPIEDADKIESLEVFCGDGGKWRGTAVRGQFKKGDLCRVYLQDSLIPKSPEFSFMEKNNWRVRMMRLRGVPSEVLIMPLISGFMSYDIGSDITDISGVTKYVKPIPEDMIGIIAGDFPSYIHKSDEPNFQSVPKIVDALRGKSFYSSVKANGFSATVFDHNGHFGCCSRTIELVEDESNMVWKFAKQYDLKRKLNGTEYAFQFEMVGPGILKNQMGFNELKPLLFDIYDIKYQKYLPFKEMMYVSADAKFPTVDIIEHDKPFLFNNDDEIRKYAEGLYASGKQREGVVIRSIDNDYLRTTNERMSFKVINLLHKD